MSKEDIFDEFLDEDFNKNTEEFKHHIENQGQRLRMRRQTDKINEVGKSPELPPEIIRRREIYRDDFIDLHLEVFPDSTGLKPFGGRQKQSIEFGHDVFRKGAGRLLKLEPRGYAKTTRITNEVLAALLLGMQDYVVIICSNLEKASDILESMKTEIYNNDVLLELFPGPIGCFRHLGDTPQKARFQTYDGYKTYIEWGTQTIQFPRVEGEPSSGKLVEVRPMTNVKGLHKKIETGPDAGKVMRPTLYIFDDPQTHDDAISETSTRKIIARIKRDALRGGSHSKRAAAIMSITPVAPGDVAWHFEQIEHSWEIIKYKMLEKFPDNHAWWMEVYAKVYLNYDRKVRGDKIRASLEAKTLLEENWDYAHEGSDVTWEHAYGWDERPQTEISPVQHAYHIILDDGWQDFEYECQCNTEYGMYQDGETIHAPIIQIKNKTLPYKRTQVPQETTKMVAHIDVNKEILTYVIMTSPHVLRPSIIDYGTWPKQPGIFSKRSLTVPMQTLYPEHIDYRERIYLGVKDVITSLMDRRFYREDGIEVHFDRIGVDIRYEELYVTRALKESAYRSNLRACAGLGVDPDDVLLHLRNNPNAIGIFENCYVEPNRLGTLDVLYFDTNYFKTELHKGFNLESGVRGSINLFGKEFDGTVCNEDRHLAFAEHCNAERAIRKVGKKKGKTKIAWEEKMHQADNEYFDNSVNCLALLIAEGAKVDIDPSPSQKKTEDKQDMKNYMQAQRGQKLL